MNDEENDILRMVDSSIVSDLHNKGKKYIDHFSNVKMKYKKFSLKWATAYLLGLFYICVYEEQVMHINKYNLIAFATIFTIFGMKLIQFLDINIGHEQLRRIFRLLLQYEKTENSLIKPYTKIEHFLYQKNFDPVFIDFAFYLSINFAIAALGILALILKMKTEFLLNMAISIGFIAIFLAWQIATLIYLMRGRHKRVNSHQKKQ